MNCCLVVWKSYMEQKLNSFYYVTYVFKTTNALQTESCHSVTWNHQIIWSKKMGTEELKNYNF